VAFSEGGHLYPATDIFAPAGAQFVAVTSGVVDFVSTHDLWNPVTNDPSTRGGLSVAIIGDDGVRYYGAHLAAIAPGIQPGVRVNPGQLLGWIGNSGDAAGRQTHLHFGISPPTYPGDWLSRRGLVDPFPYLVAWKAGATVTPVLANIDLTQVP
jgi:murein DD-endopeptidase MepM/ murein hydrolase activator NlpD